MLSGQMGYFFVCLTSVDDWLAHVLDHLHLVVQEHILSVDKATAYIGVMTVLQCAYVLSR